MESPSPAKGKWKKRLASGLALAPAILLVIWKGGFIFDLFVGICAILCAAEWLKLSLKTSRPYTFIFAGLLFLGCGFWSCYRIRSGHDGVGNALYFIVMIWISDIGAYVAGKNIGGPKMSPTISPNKTWAGFTGALVAPAILICAVTFYLNLAEQPKFTSYLLLAGIAILLGFMGQAGDLLVSWFKRSVNVKDSSDLIPGHGGILDRTDSLMLSAPVYLGILTFVERYLVS